MTAEYCGCYYDQDNTIHFCKLHKAAPELLEACEEAHKAIAIHFDDPDAWSLADMLPRLESIIAKARGES